MKYSSLTGCRKSSDVSKSEDDTKSLHGSFYYFQTFHSYSCDGDVKKQDTLKIRTARKLHKRQPDAAHKELIGADGYRRRVADGSPGGDQIVLVDAVAADPD